MEHSRARDVPRTMDRPLHRMFLGVTAAAIALAAAMPARACVNEYYLEVDRKTQAVERAEALLEAGRPAAALRTAAAARARARVSQPMRARGAADTLDTRISQVMAVAIARLGGAADVERGRARPRASESDRQDALRWALDVMNRALGTGDDPFLRARRAEVLARVTGREADARAELETLAQRDLMPDAYAWAALAALRASAGDVAGGTEAMDRCKTIAGRRARAICGESPRRVVRRARPRS